MLFLVLYFLNSFVPLFVSCCAIETERRWLFVQCSAMQTLNSDELSYLKTFLFYSSSFFVLCTRFYSPILYLSINNKSCLFCYIIIVFGLCFVLFLDCVLFCFVLFLFVCWLGWILFFAFLSFAFFLLFCFLLVVIITI
jgi:hypothetical protein